MGVNRYNIAAKQPIVSNYIPMPFEALAEISQSIQQTYDKNKSDTNALIDALNVKHRTDGGDAEAYQNIRSNYENRVKGIIGKVQNNYADISYREDLDNLYRDVKKDLETGDLAHLQQNYQGLQALTKQEEEARKNGEYAPWAHGNYRKVAPGLYSGFKNADGTYNVAIPTGVNKILDRGSEADEVVKGILSVDDLSGISPSADGKYWITKQGKKIDANKIQGTFENLYINKPSYKQIQAELEHNVAIGAITPEQAKEQYKGIMTSLLNGVISKYTMSERRYDIEADAFALKNAKEAKEEEVPVTYETPGTVINPGREKTTVEVKTSLDNNSIRRRDLINYRKEREANGGTIGELNNIQYELDRINGQTSRTRSMYAQAITEAFLPMTKNNTTWGKTDDWKKALEAWKNNPEFEWTEGHLVSLGIEREAARQMKSTMNGMGSDDNSLIGAPVTKWLKDNNAKYSITPTLITIDKNIGGNGEDRTVSKAITNIYKEGMASWDVIDSKGDLITNPKEQPADIQISQISKSPVDGYGYVFAGTQQIKDEHGNVTENRRFYLSPKSGNLANQVGQQIVNMYKPKGVDKKTGKLIFDSRLGDKANETYAAAVSMTSPAVLSDVKSLKLGESKELTYQGQYVGNLSFVEPVKGEGSLRKWVLVDREGKVLQESSNEYYLTEYINSLVQSKTNP